MSLKTAFFVLVAAFVFSRYGTAQTLDLSGELESSCSQASLQMEEQVRVAAIEVANAHDEAAQSEAAVFVAGLQKDVSRCVFEVIGRHMAREAGLNVVWGSDLQNQIRAVAQFKQSVQLNAGNMFDAAVGQVLADLNRGIEQAASAQTNGRAAFTYAEFRQIYAHEIKARIAELQEDANAAQRLIHLKSKHSY
jgi:hypothetical protein